MRRTGIPSSPVHPERVCWGCDKYCPASDLACGNGTIRTLHPIELFGDDWIDWFDRAPGGDDVITQDGVITPLRRSVVRHPRDGTATSS